MSKLSFASARAFDGGLAALACLSAGFLVFAMPETLFTGLVETSRLPDFVPAAQPPLGATARLAAAGATALIVLAAVWILMDFLGRRPASRKAEATSGAQAPKLRRADAHPDAPARRPLLARDLGEPLDLHDFPEAAAEEEAQAPVAETEHRPLPAFLIAQDEEPAAAARAEGDPGQPGSRPAEPVVWTPSRTEPALPEPEPRAEAEPLPIAALTAQLPEAEAKTDQSLTQLVHRIEFGLARKRQALPASGQPSPGATDSESDKVGHRLRSAITDLQKIASSAG